MRKKNPLTATQQARKFDAHSYRDRVQQVRAPFEDRRQDAALALAELKAGKEELGVWIERKP
jgi:hypothetical protein